MVQSIRYPYTVQHTDGKQTIPIQWLVYEHFDIICCRRSNRICPSELFLKV